MKRRKGFTLIELLVVMTVSLLVLGMVLSSFDMMQNAMAKNKAKSETETYIDNVVLQMTRTFTGARYIQVSSTNTASLTMVMPGFLNKQKITAPSFSRGFALVDPPYAGGDYLSSGEDIYGDILVLLAFAYENPLYNRSTTSVDYWYLLGVSNMSSGQVTDKSNLVYVEYNPLTGGHSIKNLVTKPELMWIRRLEIIPQRLGSGSTNNKILNFSLSARHYMKRSKISEDLRTKHDVYNYETTKFFTLYIRGK